MGDTHTDIQTKQFQRFSKEENGGNVQGGKATQISSTLPSGLNWTNTDYTAGNIGYKFLGWTGKAVDMDGGSLSVWEGSAERPFLVDAAIIPQATAAGFCLSGAEKIDLSANWQKMPFTINYLSVHENPRTGVSATLTLPASQFPHQYYVEGELSTFKTIGRTEQAALSNGYDITWDPVSIQPYDKNFHTDGKYGTQEITSIWTPYNYTITYEYNGGTPTGSTANWPKTYNIESMVSSIDGTTCPISRSGYGFKKWSIDSVGGNGKLITWNGSVGSFTTSAEWTVDAYKLRYYGGNNLSNGYLSVSYNGTGYAPAYGNGESKLVEGVEYGKKVTFTYNVGTPASGYKLDHVVLLTSLNSAPVSSWGPADFSGTALTAELTMPALPDMDNPAHLSATWRDVEGLITFYPGY